MGVRHRADRNNKGGKLMPGLIEVGLWFIIMGIIFSVSIFLAKNTI